MAEYTRNVYGLVESDAFYMISPAGKDHLSRQWPYLSAAVKSVRPFFESRHVSGTDWDAKLEGLSFGDLRKRHRWRVASHYEPDNATETFYLQVNDGTDNAQAWRTRLSVPATGAPHLVTTFEPTHFYVDTLSDGSDNVYLKRPAPSLDFKETDNAEIIPGHTLAVNSAHFYLETSRGVAQSGTGAPGNRVTLNLAEDYALASDVGANYIHEQTVPATEWSVVHNFNKPEMLWAIQDDQHRAITPDEIDFSNPNMASFYFSGDITGRVIVSTGNVGETFVGVDNIGVDVTDGTNTYLAAQELNFANTHFYLSRDLAGNPVVNFIPSPTSSIVVDDGVHTYATADGVTFNNSQFYLTDGTPATRPVVSLKTTALPFGTSADSGNLAITINGAVTFTHGLGVEPDLVILKLVCVTNDGSYTAGDVVMVGCTMDNNDSFTTNRSINTIVSSTVVTITNCAGIIINTKTGGGHYSITSGSWRYKIKALVL